MTASIKASVKAYEAWLGAALGGDMVEADLAEKHDKMHDGPFPFLRATYWRWAQTIFEVCPDLASAPPVLAIGDTHVENFGCWRDAEGASSEAPTISTTRPSCPGRWTWCAWRPAPCWRVATRRSARARSPGDPGRLRRRPGRPPALHPGTRPQVAAQGGGVARTRTRRLLGQVRDAAVAIDPAAFPRSPAPGPAGPGRRSTPSRAPPGWAIWAGRVSSPGPIGGVDRCCARSRRWSSRPGRCGMAATRRSGPARWPRAGSGRRSALPSRRRPGGPSPVAQQPQDRSQGVRRRPAVAGHADRHGPEIAACHAGDLARAPAVSAHLRSLPADWLRDHARIGRARSRRTRPRSTGSLGKPRYSWIASSAIVAAMPYDLDIPGWMPEPSSRSLEQAGPDHFRGRRDARGGTFLRAVQLVLVQVGRARRIGDLRRHLGSGGAPYSPPSSFPPKPSRARTSARPPTRGLAGARAKFRLLRAITTASPPCATAVPMTSWTGRSTAWTWCSSTACTTTGLPRRRDALILAREARRHPVR